MTIRSTGVIGLSKGTINAAISVYITNTCLKGSIMQLVSPLNLALTVAVDGVGHTTFIQTRRVADNLLATVVITGQRLFLGRCQVVANRTVVLARHRNRSQSQKQSHVGTKRECRRCVLHFSVVALAR